MQIMSTSQQHSSRSINDLNMQSYQARFPFKSKRLRCVNENRKKRMRLRWQAANHGCHCFDRAFLLAGACVCCVKFSTQALAFLAVFVYATHATQAFAFEWKPGFTLLHTSLSLTFTHSLIQSFVFV